MSRRQFAYLVLRVGAEKFSQQRNGPIEAGMQVACSALSIEAWTSQIPKEASVEEPYPATVRMFFALGGRVSRKQFAHDIAESIILTSELFDEASGSVGTELVFRFPFSVCSPERHAISAEELAEAMVSKEAKQACPDDAAESVSDKKTQILGCTRISSGVLGLAWAFTPTILKYPWLREALAFWCASTRAFWWSVEYDDYLKIVTTDRTELPKIEGAFQNAYKAIEAVVGDPPKSDTKFAEKLEARGNRPFGPTA
jgi:hypothetical protein